MVAVIKTPGFNSPGIIVLTSNEILFGVIGRGKKSSNKIYEMKRNAKWIFGVHINGSFHGKELYFPEYVSFILCGDSSSEFLSNVKQPILECSSEFFIPQHNDLKANKFLEWDLVVVSRISKAKRFNLTTEILKILLKTNPELRVCIIATYSRSNSSESSYVVNAALNLKELLAFHVSVSAVDTDLFGLFPLTNESILSTLARSRGLLITSELEGGPRVLAEAASLGVPIYICNDIKSNLEKYFEFLNMKKISPKPEMAACELTAFMKENLQVKHPIELFNEQKNISIFKNMLTALINDLGYGIDGEWKLNDLSLRLAGHSRKRNLQIMYNEKLFVDWCNWLEQAGEAYANSRLHKEGERLEISPIAKLFEKIKRMKIVIRINYIANKIKNLLRSRVCV